MRRLKMFFKMMGSSFLKRKSRAVIALFAIVIGTAVISGLLNVYYDISVKMGREFRSYGANLIITPEAEAGSAFIPQAKIDRTAGEFSPESLVGYAPYLYGVARVESQRLVVVGTWFDQIAKVSPYWKITGKLVESRNPGGKALVGVSVAEKLDLEVGQELVLKDEKNGGTKKVTVQGIVNSGGTEDNQIFIGLGEAQELFSRPGMANVAYFSIMNNGPQLEKRAEEINNDFSGLQAQPIKKISRSEAGILEKIRSLIYLIVAIIFVSTLICVASVMMTMVVERRREIAVKRALGAQTGSLVLEFLGEGGVLGLLGGLLGICLGYLLAQVIGQSVFQTSISLRLAVIPVVVLTSLTVVGLASLIPVKKVVDVEPAVVLKGE